MVLFVAGRDQSAADQPNNLAEGQSSLKPSQPLINARSDLSMSALFLFLACKCGNHHYRIWAAS
jgi:hypothetical protein